MVRISTRIPKAKIFRFENHWVKQPGFLDVVQKAWNLPVKGRTIAGIITAKFKHVRHALKKWGKTLSQIKILIEKCNHVSLFLDQLEDDRLLSIPEFNFRNVVKVHHKKLLSTLSDYWKQRCTVRWVKLNGENTKYFHARATERYMHNSISFIADAQGDLLVTHDEKASAFLQCLKN